MNQTDHAGDVWWQKPLSRRIILAGGFGAAAALVLGDQSPRNAEARAALAAAMAPIAGLAPGAPDRSLFALNEQVLASYLMIVAPMANDIVEDGSDRDGFMSGGWWRTPAEPFNARVQEQVATLSWFYANDRPWNPYYGDETLLARLDKAIGHYLSLQHSNGSFSEYNLPEQSRAATGFGLTALTATLESLRSMDSLPETQAALEGAIRNAAHWVLDLDSGAWVSPLKAANQSVAGLVGAARAARLLDDPALGTSVDQRIAFVADNAQAPAGFFHEVLGFDFGYNFYVMLPDLAELYDLTKNEKLIQMARRWVEFASYATVREPGVAGYVVYSGIVSRTDTTSFEFTPSDDADRGALVSTFLAEIPLLAAFRSTREDKALSRDAWAHPQPDPTTGSTDVMPREKGDTSPRLWMHVLRAPEDATAADAQAAEADLPYNASDRFTENRVGTLEQQYLFVRRPGFYLAGFYGVRSAAINRTGLGLLWHPSTGTLSMALNLFNGPGWSVLDSAGVDSAVGDAAVTYFEGEITKKGPEIAREDLAEVGGVFTIHSVSASNGSETDTVVWDDGLRFKASIAGGGSVSIPLVLMATDEVVFLNGTKAKFGGTTSVTTTGLTLVRNGVRLQVSWTDSVAVQMRARGMYVFSDQARRIHVLSIPFSIARQVDFTFFDPSASKSATIPLSASASSRITNSKRWIVVRVTNLELEGTVNIGVVCAGTTRSYANVPSGQSVVAWFEKSSSDERPSAVTVTGHRVARGTRYTVSKNVVIEGP